MDELQQTITQLTGGEFIGKALAALVIVLIVAGISHVVVKWLRHLMQRDDTSLPQNTLLINIARGVIWGIGLCVILDSCFNVNMTAVIAALGVGGIALSLGFQDTLSNLIGGIQILFMRIVQPGDNIEVGGTTGVVQDVTWRQTTIKNTLGELIIIPNSVLSKNTVIHRLPIERVSVPFMVTVPDDLDSVAARVIKVAHDTAEKHAHIVTEPSVFYSEIRAEGTVGKVVVTIDSSDAAFDVWDDITRGIMPIVREPLSPLPSSQQTS